MRDQSSRINPVMVMPPIAAITDNTARVGSIIDRKNFESVTYLILTGTLTDADATFAVLLEESDASDMTGATTVAAADLIGTAALAGFTFANDNVCRKIGYAGNLRYTRMTITPSANTGNFFVAVTAILGHAQLRPQPNPPV